MNGRSLEDRLADVEEALQILLGQQSPTRTPGEAAEEGHEALVKRMREMREVE